MTRVSRFQTFALCLLPCAFLFASQPPPQFRAGVDLVHVDVSVLDPNRRPVRGLTAGDFTILEDGRPQQVAAFAAVDLPDPEEPPAIWMRDTAPDVRRNDQLGDRRLFVIVIDDAALQLSQTGLKNVKGIARDFITRLGSSDLATVVFTRDNRNAQDFTSDQRRLLAAVDTVTFGFRNSGEERSDLMDWVVYFRASVETLATVAQYLIDVPQQRKALVYIGQGIPVDFEVANTPVMAGPGSMAGIGFREEQSYLVARLQELIRRAQRANVNIYTFDVCGLRAPSVSIGGTVSSPGRPPICAPGVEVEYLLTLANATGGRAAINTNDFVPAMAQMFRENGSYYLIGFQSTNPTTDGKFRRLEVRVNRPDVEVRTRTGYYAPRAEKAAKPGREVSPLTKAISGLLPKGDFPMQAWAAPFALAGKREAAVAVVLGLRQAMPERAAKLVETVDLLVDAYGADGTRKSAHGLKAQVVLRPGPTGEAAYEVLSRIDLRPGRYQLRLAAHLASQNKSGSIYYDLDVPDFSKSAVLLSGVALGLTPGLVAAPKDKLASLIPIVPTTMRQFQQSDQVTAYLKVYQGGKAPLLPVVITSRIVDDRGDTVSNLVQRIGVDQFQAARSADYRLELPLAGLRAGAHVLQVDASVGHSSAQRDVRFMMR